MLALIAALSFGLNFYAISKTGFGNAYYAAAIRSMTQSFHNFFFVAFDPAAVVSVDKPPLGLWIQAIFVLVFGYHGWAMLLPQALAGAGSCIMMYILTAKHFGRPAGLISALVFALTPAVVVASRNNTMDMQLIFVLLVAAWFLFKAIEKSKWRYLFLTAFFVGLGFNIKMLQAYMILPAVAIIYLIFAKEKFRKRIAAGLLSLLIAVAVSFSWVIAVDLTPASSRPYVGSSTNNTVWELIVGHNGMERLVGQTGGGNQGGGFGGGPGQSAEGFGGPGGGMNGQNNNGGANTNGNQGTPPNIPNQNGNTGGNTNGNQGTPPNMPNQNGGTNNGTNTNGSAGSPPAMQNQSGSDGFGGPGGGMAGGMGRQGGGVTGNEIGTAGVFRLWQSSLYGQASWLIILALFCILAMVRRGKISVKNLKLRSGVFLFWVIWFVTMYVFFSFASFWHRYYLCMFAPALAGIIGPGFVAMVRAFRDRTGLRQYLLPASLLATFGFEIVYVWSYSALRVWLVPVMIAAAAASLLLMALHFINPRRLKALAASALMMIALLAAPFYWCMTVVMYVPENVTMPYAGPELASAASTPGMTPNQEALTTGDSSTKKLEQYLVAHYKNGSYLVVSQRADDVAQYIVDTGLPAVSYGGFLGTDNAISLSKLKVLVKEGKVTYFLVSSQNGNGNSELISYVKQNAKLISASEYGGSSSKTASSQGVSGSSLYLFQ